MVKESKIREFLLDLRSGMSFSELMFKHNLSEDRLTEILSKLNRRDLTALRRLWEKYKLTESQFTRAFAEIEEDLERKD